MTTRQRARHLKANSPRRRPGQIEQMTSLTAAVLAAIYGTNAYADDTEVSLQEVVVTATRHAVQAQDLPISITAVTGTELEESGIEDIAALAHSMAGVNYTDKGPFGGVNGSTLIIRGLNSEAHRRPAGTGLAGRAAGGHVCRRHAAVRQSAVAGSRSRRDSARPAGHAVRIGLAGRHDPLRAERARSERLRCEGRGRASATPRTRTRPTKTSTACSTCRSPTRSRCASMPAGPTTPDSSISRISIG